MKQSLTAIPALKDNYIWQLYGSQGYLLVDPGAPDVIEQLAIDGPAPMAVLVTHCHRDHIDGIATLLHYWPSTPVFGPAALADLIPTWQPAVEGDLLQLDGFSPIQVMEVPGHTLDHLAYVVRQQPAVLFCGDTLFSAGCGRLFEGSPTQMWQSLQRFAAMPADTIVCPTHEYTISNLRFAMQVEPNNQAMVDYMNWCLQQRALQQPTLPTSIAQELAVNPFMRCNVPQLQQQWQQLDALALFTMLRQWKNQA